MMPTPSLALQLLLSRCKTMADCCWVVAGAKMICVRCGKPIPKVVTGLRATCRRMGWGDILAWVFDKLGFKRLPTCGCYARQAKVNRVDAQLRLWVDPRGVFSLSEDVPLFSRKQKREFGISVEVPQIIEEDVPAPLPFSEVSRRLTELRARIEEQEFRRGWGIYPEIFPTF